MDWHKILLALELRRVTLAVELSYVGSDLCLAQHHKLYGLHLTQDVQLKDPIGVVNSGHARERLFPFRDIIAVIDSEAEKSKRGFAAHRAAWASN